MLTVTLGLLNLGRALDTARVTVSPRRAASPSGTGMSTSWSFTMFCRACSFISASVGRRRMASSRSM